MKLAVGAWPSGRTEIERFADQPSHRFRSFMKLFAATRTARDWFTEVEKPAPKPEVAPVPTKPEIEKPTAPEAPVKVPPDETKV